MPSEADSLEWRAMFPATSACVHLDLANKAPMPIAAYDACRAYLDDIHRSIGDKDRWKEKTESVRAKIATLLDARADEIAFTRNTSEGLNILAQALQAQLGDNVVVYEGEHPNNLYPWINLRRRGIECRVIARKAGPVAAEDYAMLIDARTRAVAMSLVSYNTGQRLPVEAVAARCREVGSMMIVDAVQAVGVLDVRPGMLGIDALACGSQKGLLAGYGCGFLYCRGERLDRFTPAYAARASLGVPPLQDGMIRFAATAARFEIGNPNYMAMYALDATLGLILQAGAARIEAAVHRRGDRVRARLAAAGWPVVSPIGPMERSGIILIDAPEAERVVASLKQQRIIASAVDGKLRLASHLYNDDADIEALIEALSRHRRAAS